MKPIYTYYGKYSTYYVLSIEPFVCKYSTKDSKHYIYDSSFSLINAILVLDGFYDFYLKYKTKKKLNEMV